MPQHRGASYAVTFRRTSDVGTVKYLQERDLKSEILENELNDENQCDASPMHSDTRRGSDGGRPKARAISGGVAAQQSGGAAGRIGAASVGHRRASAIRTSPPRRNVSTRVIASTSLFQFRSTQTNSMLIAHPADRLNVLRAFTAPAILLSPFWYGFAENHPWLAPSTCAAVVEAIPAAWARRPDNYAEAATPVTSAQV